MASREVIDRFLAQDHIAVVGVSRKPKEFANGVYRRLREDGHSLYPVNPNAGEIEGDKCYASVADVPDPLDGVLVMVNADAARSVVKECAARGVLRVWLHSGAGEGAVSDEAVATCRENDIEVVDGACPLMFDEPVKHIHRLHRWFARNKVDA